MKIKMLLFLTASLLVIMTACWHRDHEALTYQAGSFLDFYMETSKESDQWKAQYQDAQYKLNGINTLLDQALRTAKDSTEHWKEAGEWKQKYESAEISFQKECNILDQTLKLWNASDEKRKKELEYAACLESENDRIVNKYNDLLKTSKQISNSYLNLCDKYDALNYKRNQEENLNKILLLNQYPPMPSHAIIMNLGSGMSTVDFQ